MRSALGGRLAVLLAFLVSSAPLVAQAPNTDVWLAPLSRVGDSLVVGTPRNLTNRPGYDNQPSFTPDSKAILYTSTREDGQADIYRYDLASGAITRLTSTPESEYSATVTPDGKFFSVVRVERDSTQRLWKFPLAGGAPSLVLEQVKPVGYHAWVDDSTLALFVLGQPARLVVANVRTGSAVVAASGIGRAIQRYPDWPAVTFTTRDSAGWMLRTHSIDSPECQGQSIRLPGGNEYHVWLDAETFVTTRGDSLVEFGGLRGGAERARVTRLQVSSDRGRACVVNIGGQWQHAIDLSRSQLRNVSRIAVSPDRRWLAFVAEPSTR